MGRASKPGDCDDWFRLDLHLHTFVSWGNHLPICHLAVSSVWVNSTTGWRVITNIVKARIASESRADRAMSTLCYEMMRVLFDIGPTPSYFKGLCYFT
jgi:hypothetical protein